MPRTHPALLPCSLPSFLLAALLLSPPPRAAASDVPLFTARLTPARGAWIPAGTPLRLELDRLSPAGTDHLDLGSLRLRLDGVEILGAYLEVAATHGRVGWNPTRSTLTLEAPAPLPPGPHTWTLSCRPRRGVGRLAWRGDFTVYTPQRAIPLARRIAEGLPGAHLKVEDFEPPTVTLDPPDLAFLHDETPPLRITWSDRLTFVDPTTARILLNNKDVTALFTRTPEGATWQVPASQALPGGVNHLVVQVKDGLGNLAVASAAFYLVDDARRAPWPFQPTATPGIVGHTHHQYQNYSSNPASAYFHHGVDIMPAPQSALHACRGGRVTAMYWYGSKPYYFEVAITDADGFVWQYHHVDEPTVPQAVKTAFATQSPLPAGAHLGNIVWWPASSYGKRFHHVHLNVLDGSGRYLNPLHLILKQKETTAPTIGEILFVPDGGSTAVNTPGGPRPTLRGPVDIVARAEDKDGLDVYQLTLYRMDWSVAELGGTRTHNIPFTPLWIFDCLPGGDRYAHVHDVFQRTVTWGTTTRTTQGNYSGRTFFYNLTNRLWGLPNPAGCWDTGLRDIWNRPLFPNGIYRVTVRATDESGNSVTKYTDVEIRN